MILLVAAVWLAACAAISAVPSLAAGAETPEAAAREYLSAVASGHTELALSMVSQVSKEYMSVDELADPFGVADKVDPSSIDKLQLSTTWLDPFTCLVEGPMVSEYSTRPEFSLVVAREQDQWRVKPVSRAMTDQKAETYPASFVAPDGNLSYGLLGLTASADFAVVCATINIEANEPTMVDVSSLHAILKTDEGEYQGCVTLYGFDGPEYKGEYGSYPLGPGLASTVRITMEGGRGLPDKGEWELFVEDASGPLGLMIILPMLSDPLVPGRWVDLNGEQVQ